MVKFRNTILAALGLIVLNTVIVLYTTKTGHAGSPVPVVQVTGTTSTEEVNNPDFQPFVDELFPASGFPESFTVPAGKRLCIDYVTPAIGTGTVASNVDMTIIAEANGLTIPYFVL